MMEEPIPIPEKFKVVKAFEGEGDILCKWFAKRINANQNVILVTSGSTGCLSGDTKLYSQDKTIEELYNSGEIFVDTYSIMKPIRNKGSGGYYPSHSKSEIIPSGDKEVYEIELENGTKVKATKEHKFFILRSGKKIEITLEELREGDKLVCYPKDYINKFYQETKDKSKVVRDKKWIVNMYCSKVKSIKKIGVINTFDLNTPKYENFMLDNGILSHNSGKSMANARMGELWYSSWFSRKFPSANICFSMEELVRNLKKPDLKKGELFILEEGGANYSSQEWQNKSSRLFSFIMQSFRSLNIILIINLPAFSFLNKQARILTHAHFTTCSIDYIKKTVKLKPLMHQFNNTSGKSYWKYLPYYKNGNWILVKRMNFGIPSQELINEYELKKHKFVDDLSSIFLEHLDNEAEKQLNKLKRKDLSTRELLVYNLLQEGLNQTEIAKKVGISDSRVSDIKIQCEFKGYFVGKKAKSLRKSPFSPSKTSNESPLT